MEEAQTVEVEHTISDLSQRQQIYYSDMLQGMLCDGYGIPKIEQMLLEEMQRKGPFLISARECLVTGVKLESVRDKPLTADNCLAIGLLKFWAVEKKGETVEFVE